jgi:hypothetical protein
MIKVWHHSHNILRRTLKDQAKPAGKAASSLDPTCDASAEGDISTASPDGEHVRGEPPAWADVREPDPTRPQETS